MESLSKALSLSLPKTGIRFSPTVPGERDGSPSKIGSLPLASITAEPDSPDLYDRISGTTLRSRSKKPGGRGMRFARRASSSTFRSFATGGVRRRLVRRFWNILACRSRGGVS